MKLTRASSYALHAVAYMAQQKSDRPVASHKIAQERGIPERFLLKVLKPLVSARVLTSIKGVTGHALGAAGAIEAVASVLTIERRTIPPTAGYATPDPELHLDIVAGAPRPWEPGPVLSNSFGFGGHNGCLIFVPTADG